MTDSMIPQPRDLYNPVLQALRRLGGSGTNMEIHDEVVSLLDLSDEQVQIPHKAGSNQTMLNYRLGWARTYLRHYGLLENSARGVWALTQHGLVTDQVDSEEVYRAVVQMIKQRGATLRDDQPSPPDEFSSEASSDGGPVNENQWRDSLFNALTSMHPSAFERLFQRILRESGFTQVDVTGRSGDGGIDGIGVIRIGGFLSFRVLFQCKRYKGSIGAGAVRDFRGAMIGRTDKGLIVTTGNFTPAAVREATRDGAPEIDLIDGEQLMDKLKELALGVKTEEVVTERVIIDKEWFSGI